MHGGGRLRTPAILSATLLALAGCQTGPPHRLVPPPGCEPVFSQYHLDQFHWGDVARVLVLPFATESASARAADEMGRALRAELQQLGRFEVIAAPPDDLARLSDQIHRGGRFNEAAMLELGRAFRADVVIHGTVTQYSPYPRPRVGITLQAVAPSEAKVIASVDGLWDANHLPIAKRAQNYYLQRKTELTPYHEANWIYPDDGHADELALLSPQLYQRWVCSELAAILVQDPAVDGTIFAPRGTKALTPVRRPAVPPGNLVGEPATLPPPSPATTESPTTIPPAARTPKRPDLVRPADVR